jgi:hypothetical protein
MPHEHTTLRLFATGAMSASGPVRRMLFELTQSLNNSSPGNMSNSWALGQLGWRYTRKAQLTLGGIGPSVGDVVGGELPKGSSMKALIGTSKHSLGLSSAIHESSREDAKGAGVLSGYDV